MVLDYVERSELPKGVSNVDTPALVCQLQRMPQRQMKVFLPESQAQFVRSQVAQGRYRTVSEVVRDGLRLLEQAEHRRLVEKWIIEELSDEELAVLPEELKAQVRAHFKKLIDDGLRSAEEGGWIDGPSALAELRERLTAHHRRPSDLPDD